MNGSIRNAAGANKELLSESLTHCLRAPGNGANIVNTIKLSVLYPIKGKCFDSGFLEPPFGECSL